MENESPVKMHFISHQFVRRVHYIMTPFIMPFELYISLFILIQSGAEEKSKLEIKSKLLEINQSSQVILQQD
jgi:hypothetical protein